MQVLDGGFYVGVTKQALYDKDIGALIQLVGGKAVTEGVDTPAMDYAGFFFARS